MIKYNQYIHIFTGKEILTFNALSFLMINLFYPHLKISSLNSYFYDCFFFKSWSLRLGYSFSIFLKNNLIIVLLRNKKRCFEFRLQIYNWYFHANNLLFSPTYKNIA